MDELIGEMIAKLRDKGRMAVLPVQQDLRFAYGLGDAVYLMQRGRVAVFDTKAMLAEADLAGRMAA